MDDLTFLLELKAQIESDQESLDGEFGACRTRERLAAEGDMPDCYYEVIRRLAIIQG